MSLQQIFQRWFEDVSQVCRIALLGGWNLVVPRTPLASCGLHERCIYQALKPSWTLVSAANLVREKRRARGRDRLAVCRTRSSHPWALIGCSRQPVVLQTASQSLPETPITEIIRNKGDNHLSACPGNAGCLPARIRYLPQIRPDSMRMKQPSVGKRRRFAVFRTIICREQMTCALSSLN
jgi:hypothetical protein